MIMHNERYLTNYLRNGFDSSAMKALNAGKITKKDIATIQGYLDHLAGVKDVGAVRVKNVGVTLVNVKRFIKPQYMDLTLDDIIGLKVTLSKAKTEKGEGFKQNTQAAYIKTVKAFARYLATKKGVKIDLIALSEIKAPKTDYHTETETDLLSKDDIAALVRACNNNRDRAMIYVLYETGARAGEFCRITWADISIQPGMVKVRIDDEKLRQERIAYVIEGSQYLISLKNETGGNGFVFSARGREFTYTYLQALLNRIAIKANIGKRVHLHLFRKSRISHMVDDGYSDGLIREMFWGNQQTAMYKTYVKKSAKASEKEMMIKAGLVAPEGKAAPIRCICGEIHGPEVLFCPKTGQPQNKQAGQVDNDIMATIRALQAKIEKLESEKGRGDQAPAPAIIK